MTQSPEHPVEQDISMIEIACAPDFEPFYKVGIKDGEHLVTRIEATTKSGLHANIPYVRVWAGDHCIAEFCQHNIVGVYFAPRATPAEESS